MHIPQEFFEEMNEGGGLFASKWRPPWVAWLLAGLGIPFIIHHPSELRDVVRQYALALAGYAQQPDK